MSLPTVTLRAKTQCRSNVLDEWKQQQQSWILQNPMSDVERQGLVEKASKPVKFQCLEAIKT